MSRTLSLFIICAIAISLAVGCAPPRPRGGQTPGENTAGDGAGGQGDRGGDGEGGGIGEGEGEGDGEPDNGQNEGGGGGVEGAGGGNAEGGAVAHEGDGGEGTGEGEEGGEGHEGASDEGGQGGDENEGAEGAEGEGDEGVEREPGEYGHCFVADSLSVGGDAFDLDGDGVGDNALGLAGFLVNPSIAETIGTSLLLLIGLEADDPDDNGPFDMHVLAGLDGDGNPNNNLSGEAEFTVDPSSLDEDGNPRATSDGAEITRGVMYAEPGFMALAVPVDGQEFLLNLNLVRIEAEVDGNFDGLNEGRLGGAVDQDELNAALEVLPIDPGTRPLIEGFLRNPDMDVDGDGRNESFSIALSFSAVSCVFAAGGM